MSYVESPANKANHDKQLHQLIRVEWLDSGLSYTDGWDNMEAIVRKTKLATVETVGILFWETEDTIYVALSVHENDAYGVQLIAKDNIVSQETLMRSTR